jgi:hypothetical protein
MFILRHFLSDYQLFLGKGIQLKRFYAYLAHYLVGKLNTINLIIIYLKITFMQKKLQLFTSCLLWLCGTMLLAQPVNDACSGATSIQGLFGQAIGSLQFDGPYNNTLATPTAGLADPSCFPDGPGAASAIDNDLWFTFVGDGNTYFIETSDCNGGLTAAQYITDGDTQIQIYTGSCGSLVADPNGCNEDGPSATDTTYPAGLTFETVAGTTYYLMIDGYNAVAGRFCINVTQQDALSCASLDPGTTINLDVNPVPYLDTMFIATDGPVLYPSGQVSGLAWVISFDTLATGNVDPRDNPSYWGSFPIDPNLNGGTYDVLGFINNGGLPAGYTWCFTPVVVANATGTTSFNTVVLDPDCFQVGETICIDFECNDVDAGTLSSSIADGNVCFGETITLDFAGTPVFSVNSDAGSLAIAAYAGEPDPTLASESPLYDPNFIGFFSVDEALTITNTFGDGIPTYFAPVTLEYAPADSLLGVVGDDASIDSVFFAGGSCINVGPAVMVTFQPEIILTEAFTSCYTAFFIEGGSGTYTYTITDSNGAVIDSGDSENDPDIGDYLVSNSFPTNATYTVAVTDLANGCSTTATFVSPDNTDMPGTAEASTDAVCFGASVDVSTSGASLGASDSLFSNVIVWLVSEQDLNGEFANYLGVVAVTNDVNEVLTFDNTDTEATGTFYFTPMTASLVDGDLYADCPIVGNSVMVTFLSELTATATGDGCSITVTATGGDAANGYTFNVLNSNNEVVASGDDANSTVELSANGDYTVNVTDDSGCTVSAAATLADCCTPITCNDNDCLTEDTFDTATCSCVFTPIETPTCDDGNCGTTDTYNTATCQCEHTPITPPNCDDNNCNTTDSYNTSTCQCEHVAVTPPSCDDNNCATADTYNSTTCECEHAAIVPITGFEVSDAVLCSGESITLTAASTIGTVSYKYSTNPNFDPYTAGTAYTNQAITATGCDPVTYYFKAYITGTAGCEESSDAISVMVYPAIQASTLASACGASVSINGNCNYTVSWEDNSGNTGAGSYSLDQQLTTQNTSVVFMVANPAAPDGCGELVLDPVSVTCPALVCSALDGNQSVDTTPLCSGSSPAITNGAVLNNDFSGGSITWVYSTDADFDPATDGEIYEGQALTAGGCLPIVYYFVAILSDVESCSDQSETFAVSVYPPIDANSNSGSDCNPASVTGISVECGFAVTWADSDGNVGTGPVYLPETGAIGTVTFTITNTAAPSGCQAATYTASYNCSDLVCAQLDGSQSVLESAICSGQSLTLTTGGVIDNDFPGGSVTWVYGTTSNFNAYSGTVFTGALPANTSCSVQTYYVRARLDGVGGCSDQSNSFIVSVYPSINATAVNGTCSASVTTNCPSFAVTHNSISGNSFTAQPGQSGSVTFVVSNLAGAPSTCSQVSVTATYDCPSIVCSTLDGNQNVTQSSICSGGNITVANGGVNNGSFSGGIVTWVYGTTPDFDAYTGTAFTGSLPAATGCNPQTYFLKARLDGVADCTDQSSAFAVSVYPQLSNLISLNSGNCSASITTSCTNLNITWTYNGQQGTGNTVIAEAGTSGTATFTISNAAAPLACSNATLTASLNCPEEPTCTPNEAGVCSLTYLNLNPVNGRVDVCENDGVQAVATGQAVNDPSYTGGFILHNNPTGNLTAPGTIIYDYSVTGEFINDGSYPVGQVLYVSAAVLPAPFGSTLSGECADFSAPTDLMFFNDMSAAPGTPQCDYQSETYVISYNLSGGAGNYTADGGQIINNAFITDPIAFGASATYTITDGAGCSYAIEAAHSCGNQPDVENINLTLSTLVSNNISDNLSNYVADVNGDNLNFSFGAVSPAGAGTFNGNPQTGSFTFTVADGFVGTVTIPFTVSDGNTPPVNGTITILVSNVVLDCSVLDSITIAPSVLVNALGGNYDAWIQISGGLPSVDGSSYNVTITTDNGFVYAGEHPTANDILDLQNIPFTQEADSAFVMTITATDNLGCSGSIAITITTNLNVSWLSFEGEVQAEGNLLRWITASEVNNDYFVLERSTDGQNFVTVQQVDGKGTTNTISSYEYLDRNAPKGTSYYRISQVDYDGSRTQGGWVALTRNEVKFGVTGVYPVPANHQVNIQFNAAQVGKVQAAIHDAAGKLVEQININAQAGNNVYSHNVTAYPTGVYFITLNDGQTISTTRFVK